MCGICGYSGDTALGEQNIKKMLRVINHRGPDDEGIYVNHRVGIGMCRLSIVDLKNGHQPIHNEAKNIWVVFNGEIYNYESLKKNLLAKDHKFYTNSDTEVIVHLYEEYEEDFVCYLSGMFTIAIWDDRKKRLLLARDRAGVKPLYYYVRDNTIVFASEIKSLLNCEFVETGLNYKKLGIYLKYRYIPGKETMFSNIYELLPGHFLLFDDNLIKINKYWDIDFNKENEEKSEYFYAQNVSSLFNNSVESRLISDVPIGVFLSGGLDSCIVLSKMAKIYNGKIKTFSVAFEKPQKGIRKDDYDELDYARKAAIYYGSDHYEYIIKSDEVINDINKMIWHLDEPLSDPTAIPLYYVSKLAKKHVKVVLSGEGADEIFAGYTIYKEPRAINFYNSLPEIIRNKMIEPIKSLLPFKYGNDFIKRSKLPVLRRYKGVGMTFNEYEIKNLLNDELYNKIQEEQDDTYLSSFLLMPEWEDKINQMLYFDQKVWLPEDVLIKSDKLSMANSIELRTPFLDHKLMEFAATIPSNLKYKGNCEKYILKKAFRKDLPEFVIKRKKNGFPVPISDLLLFEYKNLARDILMSQKAMNRGYFNKSYIKELLDEKYYDKNTGRKIWMLVTLELWNRIFIDNIECYTAG